MSSLKSLGESNFRDEVYATVARIPAGKVTTYGTIAALCGKPRAARIVGGIAHFGPSSLPWQRVVKSGGLLAEGFPGGVSGHKQALEAEGVSVSSTYRVLHLEDIFWSGQVEESTQ